MTTPVFPALPSGKVIDSASFEVGFIDPAMRAEMDGGYTVSRARNTRTPRRTFKGAYKNLDNADKAVLEAFYIAVKGGSMIFEWTDPESLTVYLVRIKSWGGFKYVGYGINRRWDCSFELEQA